MKMTKEQAFEFLKNKKTMVVNEEQSKEVQKKLFEVGFEWVIGGAKVCHADNPYLFTSDYGFITRSFDTEHFKNSESEFIFPFDIEDIEIVEEKKEPQFKVGEWVLVRCEWYDRWELTQYAYHSHDEEGYKYHTFGGSYYYECIPYKGNESLLGTCKNKEEEE